MGWTVWNATNLSNLINYHGSVWVFGNSWGSCGVSSDNPAECPVCYLLLINWERGPYWENIARGRTTKTEANILSVRSRASESLIRRSGAKGYGFWAFLVWNRVQILTILVWNRVRFVPPPGGVLPYISYIGMCGAKGYGFWAFLISNRV